MVFVANLQTSGDPDVEDADVDGRNEYCRADHDVERAPTVGNDDTDTINDDLEKQLYLDTPPKHFAGSVCAWRGTNSWDSTHKW